MGQKVNFNKKKNNSLKLIMIIIIVLLILLYLIKVVKDNIHSTHEDTSPKIDNTIHYDINDYNSIEALLASHNCKVNSKSETSDLLKLDVSFGENLYDGETSNERYFNTICNLVAEYIKYKNFSLVDNSKKIKIEVKCEENKIIEIKINDDVNYYLNQDSFINKNLSNNVTNFNIQSPELQALIDGDWDETKVNFGTRESICDGYNIYFDEGIEYRVVNRKVYNVIFTSKYSGQIAGTLNANSTKEEIESALGKPTFTKGNEYGYLGKYNYLFFDFTNNEVSIYPVVEVTEDDEKELKKMIEKMNETKDIKKFTTDLTSFWLDYDKYNYDSYYVDLRYTLKGFQVSIDSRTLKNGIYIYPNYSGNRDILDLDNVYIKDTDFVCEEESNRSNQSILNRIEQGDFTEKYYNEYLGKDFSVRFNNISSDSTKYTGPKFYSRNKEYPDSELDRNMEISSYIWYDESKLVYSVNDDGIYIYDCKMMSNTKLTAIEGDIKINSIKDNIINYNENFTLNLNY